MAFQIPTREHAGNTWTFNLARGAWTPCWPVFDAEKKQLTRVDPVRMAVLTRQRSWFTSYGEMRPTLAEAMDAEIAWWSAEDGVARTRWEDFARVSNTATTLREQVGQLEASLACEKRRTRNLRSAVTFLALSLFFLAMSILPWTP